MAGRKYVVGDIVKTKSPRYDYKYIQILEVSRDSKTILSYKIIMAQVKSEKPYLDCLCNQCQQDDHVEIYEMSEEDWKAIALEIL